MKNKDVKVNDKKNIKTTKRSNKPKVQKENSKEITKNKQINTLNIPVIILGGIVVIALGYLLFMSIFRVKVQNLAFDGNEDETVMIGDELNLDFTFSPVNASKKTISWVSSDTSVATVHDGIVRGISEGVVTIIAQYADGKSTSVTVWVTDFGSSNAIEEDNEPSGIALDQAEITMYSGETVKLIATVLPDTVSQYVVWSSSDNSAATVDQDGVISAMDVSTEKKVQIIATTINGISINCDVTVYPNN